ncbi:MAG TPA: CDP-alcohol phosphatidyltransferase family protein [Candidatus Thermoplasmatota archaeon]|nr:CDP-alcohol phosphatidyltransferase family protein [Candidatus Thermoplasmatota archaeon]
MASRWAWAPHALSFARVLFVLGIYVAALRRDEPLFALLVLAAILTDILDGPLARHLGTASRFGANVDSAADLVFYVSLPIWTWLFRPEVVIGHRYEIAVFTVLYVAANILSHAKFGALGVHNRLSRTSGTVGVVGTFYVILWGVSPVVYFLVVGVLAGDLAQRYAALLRANFGKKQDIIQ